MRITAIPAEALRALAMNRLRTALAMLGMIIGVGAVVLMLAVGQGAQTAVASSIASMGSNLFIVLAGATTSGGLRFGSGTAQSLTVADALAMTTLPSVAAVAPVLSGTAQMSYGNANWSTLVYATTPDYLAVRNWALEQGHAFGDAEMRGAARVVLLGYTAARNLFGDEEAAGRTIQLKGSPYLVLGVLEKKGQSLDGRDQDDVALVPLTTGQRKLFGGQFRDSVRYIMVKGVSAQTMDEAEQEMVGLLRQRHRLAEGAENDFTVRNLSQVAETAAVASRVLSVMLGAIASVSLLVGGIGIMNIMLVSVTERTREIGLRMAVGARHGDILFQFLFEAVLICGLGGVAGAGLGVLGAWGVATVAGVTVEVTGSAILLAFGCAAGIGTFFGFYPARKAALLNPVEALRAD